MPAKKSAGSKFQSPRFPAATREAAKTFAAAKRVRSKIGKLAYGKPKSSKVHRDYAKADRAYQTAGRALAKRTGYKWR
jgi:hypothetical protein